MSKQVPENVPSREEQLSSLRKELIGNSAFSGCRGKWNSDGLLDLVEKNDSPTQFCQKWDKFSGYFRIMGNLLAKYRRDGWQYAADALEKALRCSLNLLPGETIPLEMTEPVTIVMLDPERTLVLLNWLLESDPVTLNSFIRELSGENPEMEVDIWTRKLFELFPSLVEKEHERIRLNKYPGSELIEAYSEHVLKKFPKIRTSSRLEFEHGQYSSHVEFWNNTVAYAVLASQKEVLKMFSRDEQEMLATWSFNIPKDYLQVCINAGEFRSTKISFDVGFYSENEHELWKKEFPMMVSNGFSNGLGAIIDPPDRVDLTCGQVDRSGHWLKFKLVSH